jgi:acyl carrier protein
MSVLSSLVLVAVKVNSFFGGRRGMMSVREVVQQRFASAAKSRNSKLPPLTDDLKLMDSGLDSLSFAVIVTQLEDELGFDPFNEAVEVIFPVTFGDFVRLYENHRA